MDNKTVRALVDAGIHFGHRAGRWNPKMKPYIFCTRNSIHIIDIKETIKGIMRARKFLTSVAASGKDVLFVGTKRQARGAIVAEANRVEMPFVSERWLGGTLTNFSTIRKRLARLEELEDMESRGVMAAQSKKMESMLRRELRKIKRNLDGIRKMDRVPGALVIIDAMREHLAIGEARKLGIPTICLLDTDSDPDLVNIPIPGNDDAMRVIELVIKEMADAVLEGKAGRVERRGVSEDGERRRVSKRATLSQFAEESAGQPIATETTPAPAEANPPAGN